MQEPMMPEPELYEQKILNDEEFPVQININNIHSRCEYFHPHWHEHIELHYILEGSANIRVNQTEVHGSPGALVVVNGNELHSGFCDSSHVKALVVIFEMEAFSKELAGRNIILQHLIRDDGVIDEIMRRINSENEEKAIGYRLSCRGLIMCLITHLIRNYAKEELSENDSRKRMRNLESLNTVISYVHSHYPEPISNKELSELIHLSEGRFNHLFKENMEMAPLQYINSVRLKKAMSMLRQNAGTVAQVALAVGFTDYNHFGRMFRKFYGCTPAEVTGSRKTSG